VLTLHLVFVHVTLRNNAVYQVDWVEVPSILMEYLAWDEQGLALLSGHYETGEPIPPDVAAALRASKHAFVGVETLQQVCHVT
jgi:Zn-dependent oligopeptidase